MENSLEKLGPVAVSEREQLVLSVSTVPQLVLLEMVPRASSFAKDLQRLTVTTIQVTWNDRVRSLGVPPLIGSVSTPEIGSQRARVRNRIRFES